MQMIDDLEIRKEIITAMPSRFLFSDFCDQTPEWRHFYLVWSYYVFDLSYWIKNCTFCLLSFLLRKGLGEYLFKIYSFGSSSSDTCITRGRINNLLASGFYLTPFSRDVGCLHLNDQLPLSNWQPVAAASWDLSSRRLTPVAHID